ncbi:MAG: glycerol kinase GlpK [Flammeovirgaceae bacterium]
MTSYILSIDQGTTSCRAILYDQNAKNVGIVQKEFQQYYPQLGWVEHDALEIWHTQWHVCQELMQQNNIFPHQIAAIGITNQRETLVVWDRNTGIPIYPAIVWQDRRTVYVCEALKKQGWTEKIRQKTGLVIDAYFSATKASWILKNVSGAMEKAQKGELAIGTIDSWLIWNLTKGALHITDITNASRTMLFNIHSLQWDEELLELFEIPSNVLPKVCSCSEVLGRTHHDILGAEIPISGVAGDQHAALFGQLCLEEGSIKNTYGTGCFLMLNTGLQAIQSKNQLLTTIAFQWNQQTFYALEGSVFMGGATIQWLRDGIKVIPSSRETERIARAVPDNGGIYFVPAMTGLGAPYWDGYARGTILGITRGTTEAHLVRAALEGIAFQVNDVLKAMEADWGKRITEMKVDGGASSNELLMQIQANFSQINVLRPKDVETTAKGAAFLAGMAVGFWKDTAQLRQLESIEKSFTPTISQEILEKQLRMWKKAVQRARDWDEE